MASAANVSVARLQHVRVNPFSHEGAHQGLRGYAHALKDGATFVLLDAYGWRVTCEQQVLPEGLAEIEMHGPVGEGTFDLAVYRRAGAGRLQAQIVP
jgi:hypothetical protein